MLSIAKLILSMRRFFIVTLLVWLPLLPYVTFAQSLSQQQVSSLALLLQNLQNLTAQLGSVFNLPNFSSANSNISSSSPNKTPSNFPRTPKAEEKRLPILLVKLTDAAAASFETLLEKSAADTIQNTSWLRSLDSKEKIKNISWLLSIDQHAGEKRRDAFLRISQENKIKFPIRSRRAPQNTQIPNLSTIIKIEFENKNTEATKLAQELQKNKTEILWVEPDSLNVPTAFIPNDPEFTKQWALNNTGQTGGKPDADMDLPDAWSSSKGKNVTIAIVDSGVDLNHPDLKPHLVPGYDFVDNDAIPQDQDGHGTSVAEDAAAVINNGIGTAGVAGEANIMPLRGESGSQATQAVTWATDHGADVINMSFWNDGSQLFHDAIRYAYSQGVVLVAGIGNDGANRNFGHPPALWDEVVAVGGTDEFDHRVWWSNVGSHIDVVAPVNGISSLPGDGYVEEGGTSVSAPYVSGIAALLLSANPNLTADQVRSLIKHSADDLMGSPREDTPGWDPFHGWGRVNAAQALSLRNALPLDPPRFFATPSNLNLTIPSHNCSKSYPKNIQIQNIGSGPFNWSASSNASWLTLNPRTGTSSADLAAVINATNFAAGIIAQATVTFTAPGAINSPYVVPVSGKVTSGFQLIGCDIQLTSRFDYTPFQRSPVGIQSEDGGLIASWVSDLDPPFAQKWSASGAPLWGSGGVRLGNNVSNIDFSLRSPISVVTDGQDGAIFVWNYYNPTATNIFATDIFIQRVDQAGAVRWGSSGILVQANADIRPPMIVSDGLGGVIVAWANYHADQGNFDILAQRFGSNGQKLWSNPILIAQGVYGGGTEFGFRMAADGAHGAIITFAGNLSSGYLRVYAQRVSALGTFPWGNLPIAVTKVDVAYDRLPVISVDKSGSALIAWYNDLPTAGTNNAVHEIWAQKLSASGALLWSNSGIEVTASGTEPLVSIPMWDDVRTDDYNRLPTIESDGSGGVFVAWKYFRSLNEEIYVAHIESGGHLQWRVRAGARTLLDPLMPLLATDGTGGVVVAWSDQDSVDQYGVPGANLFAQYIRNDGTLYETTPIQITSQAEVSAPQLIKGPGFLRFLWDDFRYQFDFYNSGINIYTQIFTTPAPADLAVSSLSLSPATITSSTPVTISATIKNQGAAAAPSSTAIIGVDTDPFYTWPQYAIPPLAPSSTYSISRTVTFKSTGFHQATVVADLLNKVGESNENNNTATATIKVFARGPDLTLSNLRLTSSSNPLKYWVGLDLCNSSLQTQPSFPLNITANGIVRSLSFPTINLASGKCTTQVWEPSFWNMQLGQTYKVTAVADPANQIVEENESNNTLTATVAIPSPQVSILIPTSTGAFTTTSSSILISSAITVSSGTTITSATWRNQATSQSGTVTPSIFGWYATVPLISGSNVITISATDSNAKTNSASITVTYKPPTAAASLSEMANALESARQILNRLLESVNH